MIGHSRLLLPPLFLCLAHMGAAQCSITLGNDVTICQGQTTTLLGPPGYSNYSWSNGPSTQDITVGAAGNYACTVTYPTGNLVTNGNFSAGNTGFSNQFNLDFNMQNEPTYNVGSNANWFHPQWSGTGNGNFLLINAGWMHSGWDAWCQTIPVCPNQTYTLGVRAMSVANQGAPLLNWVVDGVGLGFNMQTSSTQGAWTLFSNTWTTGAGQYSATFCIEVSSGWGVGNDFALDDISISSTIVLSDQQQVFVTPLPVVNLGPDQLGCNGDQFLLNVTLPGATYVWQDGSTGPTFNVTGAGIYDVDVTVNNCTASDAIQFWYNPYPALDLGNDTTLCTGQTLPMNVFTPGATYQWQNGSAAPSYTVTGPGTYDVDLTLNGCVSQDTIVVNYNPVPVVALGNDTTLCAGEQLLIDATTAGGTYVWQDGSTASTFNVGSAGNFDVDVTVNGCTGNDAIVVTYNPLPAFDLGNDTTVCPGEVVVWDATLAGATYLWNDASTGPTLATSATGISSVTVTLNDCSASDAAMLNNFSLQSVDLGNDVVECTGTPVPIGVNVPGATYLWNTTATSDSISVSATGTYWVEATLNGCVVRDSIDVSFTPLPVFTLGNDTSVCPGGMVVLDATLPGASYLWSNGTVGATVNAGAGVWSVLVSVNACSSTDTITIGTWQPPIVALGNDTTLCPGALLLLDAALPGASYVWQDNSTASTHTVNAAGNYNVTVTDANGCTGNDAINVAYANPQSVFLGNDTTICQGTLLTLDATIAGATYQWSTSAVTPTISVGSAGSYSVVVTQGQCTVTDAITVSTTPNPNVALPNDTTLCAGETLLLDATTAGVTYAWQNASTSPTFLVNTAGTYTVTVTDPAGCTDGDAIAVSYALPGSVDLGNDTSFCAGGSMSLDATLPGSSYLWSTGATSATVNVNSNGTYWVEALQGNCTVSDTITIAVSANPSLSLPNDTTLCAGETLLLDATTPGVSYAWQNGSTAATFLVSTAGTYTVTVTNANGCSDSDAITVAYAVPGSVNLGNDTSFCAGGSVLLDATLTGSAYIWSTGATSATLNVNASGTYWVEVIQAACSVSDTISISVNANPSVALPNDTTLCPGESLLLDATTAGVTYTWQDGSTAATFLVSTAGNYSVAVTTANGCTDNDAIIVNYAGAGSIDLGNDTSFCSGGSVLLDATLAGSTYSWNTGATSATITATTSGPYWVEALQGNCAVSDTIVITVDPVPNVALPNDTTLCGGATLLLDATTAGVTYTWQDGSTNSTFPVSAAGSYSVTVTSANGCTDSDAITVNYASTGAINIGNDTTICQGDSILLDATLPGATYLWSTGETTASILIGYTGPYTVIAQVGACIVYDTIQVIMNGVPLASAWGNDTTFCFPGTYLLPVLPADSYLWQDGSTGSSYVAGQTGLYWVEAMYGQCVYHDSIYITVEQPLPIDLGVDTAICAGTMLLLDATWPGATYLWNTGETTATVAAGPPGSYVDVTTNGCTWNYDINIAALPAPIIALGNDTTLCTGSSITLSAAQTGATYLWQDGSTAATFTTSTTVDVWVEVDLNGCTVSDSASVYFLSPTAIDLGPDTALCQGTSITLGSVLPGAQYTWSTGSTSATITASSSGVYWVEAGIVGCLSSDTIVITMTQVPQPNLGPDVTACVGDTVLFSVNPGGSNVLWSDGSTGAASTATTSGTVSVELSLNGCTASDEVDVVFVPVIDTVDIGLDAAHCPGEPLQLDASTTGATYDWSTGQVSPTITITEPGIYWVEVSGSCISAIDTIVISPGDCGLFIYVPNTFTPDGDGWNELFAAVVTGDFLEYSFTVFDRWGEAIWETSDTGASWSGDYGGTPAPDGVYVWAIRYKADTPSGIKQERLVGHVNLLR